MKTKRIYLCEDSMEGIFTGIYDAWDSRYGHENIRIQVVSKEDNAYNVELFSEYITVVTDNEKAFKVANSIRNKISEIAFSMVCHGAWSCEMDKGDVIYRFLILGFAMGNKVVNHLGNESVMKLYEMNRYVANEAHNFLGFLRFIESEDQVLMAKIKPKNDILRLLAPHFADRLSTEKFVIIDEKRKAAVVHESGGEWSYIKSDTIDFGRFDQYSKKEEEFMNLWKTFFDGIAIKERENLKLQRNHVPKRYRSNMTEFVTIKNKIEEREG